MAEASPPPLDANTLPLCCFLESPSGGPFAAAVLNVLELNVASLWLMRVEWDAGNCSLSISSDAVALPCSLSRGAEECGGHAEAACKGSPVLCLWLWSPSGLACETAPCFPSFQKPEESIMPIRRAVSSSARETAPKSKPAEVEEAKPGMVVGSCRQGSQALRASSSMASLGLPSAGGRDAGWRWAEPLKMG